MPELIADYSDGDISEDINGFQVTRVFRLLGLTGGGQNKLFQALTYPGIPLVNDPHPTVPNVFVKTKSLSILDQGSGFDITLNYAQQEQGQQEDEEEGQISITASLNSVQTNKDVNDDPIILGGQAPLNDQLQPGQALPQPALPKQSGWVQVQVPNTVVVFTRREEDQNLFVQRARDNIGKVNSAQFLGLNEKKVLCSSIQGTSNDGGATYQTNYQFAIKEPNAQGAFDDWSQTVVWVDPETKLPIPNPDEGNDTLKKVEVYSTIDFNQLGLT